MICMGMSLQPLTIYKQNLIRWSCFSILCFWKKQGSCTKRGWRGSFLLLLWDLIKPSLKLLVMNRMVSTRIQTIIPLIRKLFLFFQTHKFQWLTFSIGKMKSLKVLTRIIGWGETFQKLDVGLQKGTLIAISLLG